MSFHVQCGDDTVAVKWLREYMTSLSAKLMTTRVHVIYEAFTHISLRLGTGLNSSSEGVYEANSIYEIVVLSKNDFLVFHGLGFGDDERSKKARPKAFRLSFLTPDDTCVSIVVPPADVSKKCLQQLSLNAHAALKITGKQKQKDPVAAAASKKEWGILDILSENPFASSNTYISYIEFESDRPLPGLVDTHRLRIYNKWTSRHVPRITTEMLNLTYEDF
ncbi:hypothetical protein CYMTET_38492 [Cymbomonas tetramitiformis]|uniref:Uncharacterized protein n=1 Tax=Cymbomonas tetramitiformis TaxID=36881 RepID=A0AAE0CBZ2_9CHLO|nr:hypothetical protein CYMTET_38492 [Cymbomonas tetramitiformis]